MTQSDLESIEDTDPAFGESMNTSPKAREGRSVGSVSFREEPRTFVVLLLVRLHALGCSPSVLSACVWPLVRVKLDVERFCAFGYIARVEEVFERHSFVCVTCRRRGQWDLAEISRRRADGGAAVCTRVVAGTWLLPVSLWVRDELNFTCRAAVVVT
jgi:hypothetical protein